MEIVGVEKIPRELRGEKLADGGLSRSRGAHHENDHGNIIAALRLPQEFAEQHVKMVDTVFTLHGVAPAVVGGRPQATLNICAEADVFLLDFVAESHRALDALLIFLGSDIVEKPFENSECLFMRERDDYIC